MFDWDLPRRNNPQRDFTGIEPCGRQSSIDAHARVAQIWAGSGYQRRYARANCPGERSLLELSSSPYSTVSFQPWAGHWRALMLFLASLNTDPMFLRSRGKEAGALCSQSDFPLVLQLYKLFCISSAKLLCPILFPFLPTRWGHFIIRWNNPPLQNESSSLQSPEESRSIRHVLLTIINASTLWVLLNIHSKSTIIKPTFLNSKEIKLGILLVKMVEGGISIRKTHYDEKKHLQHRRALTKSRQNVFIKNNVCAL